MLHTDIPTRAELEVLLRSREPASVSIYVPTTPVTVDVDGSRVRSVSSYPHLADTSIAGNPETTSDADLAAKARIVLDDWYAADLATVRERFELRSSQGRASTDIVDVARAATFGAVESVFVDIDEVVPGFVDEESGAVTFTESDSSDDYGVVDEIARRAFLTGARVLAVRRDDIPANGAVAAILRFAI